MSELILTAAIFLGIIGASAAVAWTVARMMELGEAERLLESAVAARLLSMFPPEPPVAKRQRWLMEAGWLPVRARFALMAAARHRHGLRATALMATIVLALATVAGAIAGGAHAIPPAIILALLAIVILLNSYGAHQSSKISQQLPLLLSSLSNSLRAGYSFQQALMFVSRELPGPLGPLVYETAQKIALGESVTRALERLKETQDNDDLSFVIDATLIQIRKGGELTKIFSRISSSIHDRIKLQKDLRAAVSQGKLSGIIIACLWPVSLLLFMVLSPAYIEPLLTTRMGTMLLVTAAVLEIIGFFLIYRITRLPL